MSIHITPVKTETYIPSKVKDEERKPEEKPMVSSKALAVSLTALGVASLGLLAVKNKKKSTWILIKKSKYFSKYRVHLIGKSNNFSTKKEHIVVLTSNEFRQLEILNGEIPQSPF